MRQNWAIFEISCRQIFGTKVKQKFGYFLSYFEKTSILKKNCCGYFWQLLEKFGLLFIPASGHTANDRICVLKLAMLSCYTFERNHSHSLVLIQFNFAALGRAINSDRQATQQQHNSSVRLFFLFSETLNRQCFAPNCFIGRRENVSSSKKWDIPGLFFFIFIFSIQLTINKCSIYILPMAGFELGSSGIVSDRSTNCATTTTLIGNFLTWNQLLCLRG